MFSLTSKQKMGVYLFSTVFYLLLPLLLCSTLYGHVCAAVGTQTSTAKDSVEVFQAGQPIGEVLKATENAKEEATAKDVTVREFYSPAFVSVGDVLVALAAINGNSVIDNNITVLTKYIDTSNKDWGKNVFETSGGEWKAQFAVYKKCSNPNSNSVVRGIMAAAVNNNKIYLLLVNASTKTSDRTTTGELELKFWFAEGTVGDDKKITWVKVEQLNLDKNDQLTKQFEEHKLSKGAFSGSAIVTEGGKIIFLLRAHTNVKKTVFGFLYSDGGDSANNLKVLPFDGISQGCYPQFFLWEESIIMVPTQCKESAGNKNMKEITDISTTSWKDSVGPFSHLVSFFDDKDDFTTANIKNKLLLFTQKKPKPQSPGNNNHDVYLWVTDSKRFYNAGMFLNNVNVTSINLLHTNNELLVLYQQWDTSGPKNIFLRRLQTQLDNIRTVIDVWNNNEIVKQLCDDKILCATELPTNGLVGFLSDTDKDKNHWIDKYFYANATVTKKENANKVTNGLWFNGDGAGAKWEVGKEQNDQPYNFTDPGFTLVVTLKIDKNEEKFHNSLLGVVLDKNSKKPVQLWCSNGKWAVGEKKTLDKNNKKCEQGKTYIVTLVLNNDGNVLVHVDWEQMTDLTGNKIKIEKTDTIKYFYFGANTDSEKTDVTVTNALLYNWPFGSSEIDRLKVIKKEIAQPTIKNGDDNNKHNLEGNTSETDKTSGTSATPTATEKDGAEINLCSPLKNDFTVFYVLLLVGFTLLGRYVY